MKTFSPELLDFVKMARGLDYLILDTETTGLERGEICQMAIVNAHGDTVLNQYFKTRNPIPHDATMIHGITNEMVAHAMTWADWQPKVAEILKGRQVIIYNAVYDRKMMHQSDEAWGLPRVDYKAATSFHCAMLAYAEYCGDWNDYRQSYRWQKLSTAAAIESVAVVGAHDALGDCMMTLGVVRSMCNNIEAHPRHPEAFA